MSSLIKLDSISKIYGGKRSTPRVTALDGISLEIRRGEYVSIVGKSGSGKSTLLNILGCLDFPTSGSYTLSGELVSSLSEKELSRVRRRMIGFIFQDFSLIPSLNAAENVALPLVYKKIPAKERAALTETALRSVGLEGRARHLPHELSGGQQQRVAIARAIAASPEIILADEPTGNLDSESGAEITDILRSLNKNGSTVIIITHDSELAARTDRSVEIRDGKITFDSRCNML